MPISNAESWSLNASKYWGLPYGYAIWLIAGMVVLATACAEGQTRSVSNTNSSSYVTCHQGDLVELERLIEHRGTVIEVGGFVGHLILGAVEEMEEREFPAAGFIIMVGEHALSGMNDEQLYSLRSQGYRSFDICVLKIVPSILISVRPIPSYQLPQLGLPRASASVFDWPSKRPKLCLPGTGQSLGTLSRPSNTWRSNNNSLGSFELPCDLGTTPPLGKTLTQR